MWLDRIAGHSTPSGSQIDSRSNSPLPRRTSSRLSPNIQNNRPGSSRQASSLSVLLTPSDSTTSLPATAARDRSPLKQIAARSRPSDVADPLDVLNGILGKQNGKRDLSPDGDLNVKPSDLVEDIDFQGLSLEDFVAQADNRKRITSTDAGAQTVQQFEKERDKFQDLHSAITGCDEVSSSVETYLNDFQNELGAVSAEIETLQSRSIQLTAMLENRRNVEQLLGPAVEEISISPKTVRLIAEGPIDENWVKALNEMETRAASIEAKVSGSNSTKSIEDVRPLLKDIKNKAVERIRDYLVSQIRALRSPNINAQILQQQRLVKFKDLYSYISRAHPELTGQITQAYINTMRWYYLSHFTRYRQALESIKIYPSDRNEILGGDPSAHKTSSAVAGSRAGSAAHDPFSLGRRVDIMRTGAQIAISSYLAEEDNSFHGLEVPFRNFNLAVVDNVSAEYSFMTEMFSTLSFQQISRKAVEIFEPVFSQGQTLTKQLIEHTTDALGVLICVRLNQHAAFELQRRKVPVADSYINGVNMQLWPRFQVIMDTQCESLKRVAANTGRSAVSALSLAGGDDLNKSSAPHFLTQRFGQLLHGILVLSSDAGDDEPVANSLKRLTAEFDNLLTKLSRIGGDAKRRERFLFNNYSLVLAIISDTHGKLATEQKQGTSTILLERHDAPGTETSSRNSEVRIDCIIVPFALFVSAWRSRMMDIDRSRGKKKSSGGIQLMNQRAQQVIHAGLYYGTDTLKKQLCIEGKELLYDLCERQNIPYRRTGKWLVAQDAAQWEACLRLHETAQRIGVTTRMLSREEIARREPEVRAQAGVLESPTTGILDSHALITYLHGDFEDRGGDCAFRTRVTGVRYNGQGRGYEITAVTADGSETAITAETVVNSAGHGACAINNMLLPADRHRTPLYAKGTYFSYAASFPRTSVLVYPVVAKAQAGLGVHLTLDMGGQVRFGPDAEWVEDSEDLAPNPARLEQALPLIRDASESGSAWAKGSMFQDFVIQEEEGPGLTSSLAIGKMVKRILH
ncbi:Vps52-domain-containing protein [Aspergillus homomorphus CBS 101889]|uniref:Vps52-domain-containing protein n=1 Tax=Aspergillus homomorphus (strain CBS 101889) TaxID=1450537 RepID=A0A395HSK4_ASPHC|nr:Vps52-domain-containing protein [Aspergillus homomorphus CBS 101889]RAL09838.1 Vps52-domain-containing protein [Aspergillus homomorphus CBS 101889]